MNRMFRFVACAYSIFLASACGSIPSNGLDPGGPSDMPRCGVSPPPCRVGETPIKNTDANATPACKSELTVSLFGPPKSVIPAGTRGADLLRLVFETTRCGGVVVRSVKISVDSPDTDIFCGHFCSLNPMDWNFSLPRLMADAVTIDGPTEFVPVSVSSPGKVMADFEGPFAFAPDQKVLIDFRVDVALSEVVPGSLYGKHFRAMNVRIDLDPNYPATLHLPVVTGNLQTISAPP